jgi:hypothetical protein
MSSMEVLVKHTAQCMRFDPAGEQHALDGLIPHILQRSSNAAMSKTEG